jgi:hypothetical protein
MFDLILLCILTLFASITLKINYLLFCNYKSLRKELSGLILFLGI